MTGFWQGKRVFVTGHAGFKGSWMTLWLLSLGAEVAGLSLPPNTKPVLFDQLGLASELQHHLEDIRQRDRVRQIISQFQPDVVFHLAAQPLVRRSYVEPVETWETNVLGTIHVLEALKFLDRPCAAVLITTDKCYENREWAYGYRETDPLGGYDPYSSSKAAAELAIASWRQSFFSANPSPIGIASARAGNVIGGGDWAEDRIVPDAIRSLMRSQPIPVRNPIATRPWQHVLEPLGGYLMLAEQIYQQLQSSYSGSSANLQNRPPDADLCSAFNFGPWLSSNRPVRELVETLLQHWPGRWLDQSQPGTLHEAKKLNLVTDKAFHTLGWQPRWNFERTVQETVWWYQQAAQLPAGATEQFQELTLSQIQQYQRASMPAAAPNPSQVCV